MHHSLSYLANSKAVTLDGSPVRLVMGATTILNRNTIFMKYSLQSKRPSLLKLPLHKMTELASYQLNKLIKLARLKQVMWRQKIELTFWHQYCKDISEMGSSGSSLSFLLHSRISSVFVVRKKLPTHSESL